MTTTTISPATTRLPWSKGSIGVTILPEDREEVEAEIYDTLAIHFKAGYGKHPSVRPWTITHIPTGLKIAGFDTRSLAISIAETLWLSLRTLLKEENSESLKLSFPGWARDWLNNCEKEQKSIPIKYFKK